MTISTSRRERLIRRWTIAFNLVTMTSTGVALGMVTFYCLTGG